MTTTTATTYGSDFSLQAQADGIANWLSGGDHTQDERDALEAAMFAQFVDEVDDRLPEDVFWHPSTSEFAHPLNADLPDEEEMQALFEAAWEAVAGRYDEIEAEVLPVLPAQQIVAELPDDPIERAKAAERLGREARDAQETFAKVRREAIHAATRYSSYAEVAEELGVSEAAINKAVTEHGRSR
jgi:hypothetical protein